jgi:hypothetical protein
LEVNFGRGQGSPRSLMPKEEEEEEELGLLKNMVYTCVIWTMVVKVL